MNLQHENTYHRIRLEVVDQVHLIPMRLVDHRREQGTVTIKTERKATRMMRTSSYWNFDI